MGLHDGIQIKSILRNATKKIIIPINGDLKIVDDITCCYCGKLILEPLFKTKEHIIPKYKGGNDSKYNKVDCCNLCNFWKGPFSLEEFYFDVKRCLKKNKVREGFIVHDYYVMLENILHMIEYSKNYRHKMVFHQKVKKENPYLNGQF